MSETEKQVIKGFNVDKATEDQLNDLSGYELIDIILFFREELHRYKQVVEEIKEIIKFNKTNRLSGGACISIEQILQKISECEVVND